MHVKRSRNRHVGEELGSGKTVQQIIDSMNQVAEGVKASSVIMEFADKYGLHMPIAREVDAVVNHGSTVEGLPRSDGREARPRGRRHPVLTDLPGGFVSPAGSPGSKGGAVGRASSGITSSMNVPVGVTMNPTWSRLLTQATTPAPSTPQLISRKLSRVFGGSVFTAPPGRRTAVRRVRTPADPTAHR